MAVVSGGTTLIDNGTLDSAVPTGKLTLIKTLTASSSSTLSFVNGSSSVVFNSTYDSYVFKFINIHPANNTAYLTFQGSTNTGSSYGIAIVSTAFYSRHSESGSGAELDYNGSADLAQSTDFQRISQGVGNGNDESCSGTLQIFAPADTTFIKHFIARMPTYQSSNYIYDQYTEGYINTTSSIDAIQFKFSSGNIDAGTIKMYGVGG